MIDAKDLRAQHVKLFLYHVILLVASLAAFGVMVYTQSMVAVVVLISVLAAAYIVLVIPKADKFDNAVQQFCLNNTLGAQYDNILYDPNGGIVKEEAEESALFQEALQYFSCDRSVAGHRETPQGLEEMETGEIQYMPQEDKETKMRRAILAHLHCAGCHARPLTVLEGKAEGTDITDAQKDILQTIRSMTEGNYSLTVRGADAFLLLPGRSMRVKTSSIKPLKEADLQTNRLPELKLLGELFRTRSV